MNFVKTEGFFKSSNGINDVAYYVYEPAEGTVRAVVQFIHGMCEYFLRYEHFAEYLCGMGIAVVGYDHIGHGKSVNSPDEYGFFAEKNGWRCLVKDMVVLSDMMKKRFCGKKYFIAGHSMGSLVLRTALGKYDRLCDGVIIMDTVSVGFGTDAALAAIEGITAMTGKRSRSKFIDKAMFGMSNARIKNPVTRYDWICTDEAVVMAYAEDPACTFIFTNQAMYDLVMMIKYVSAPDWISKFNKEMPVLIMGGTEDPVGEYGKCPKKFFECLVNADAADVELKIYEGMRHEILNEKDKEKVFADISEWLESHIE